jgi:hypothetical protein
MALSEEQLFILRNDLRTLAHIEYEEVENELLDHYATLTEQKMDDGHDFENASSYAWAELGAGAGLNKIHRDYEKNIRKQVSTRHREILKSYFRWPTILSTAVICGLMYWLAAVISPKAIYMIRLLLFLAPGLILLYTFIRKEHRHTDARKLAWEYMNRYANLPIAFMQASNSINILFDSKTRPISFIQSHPTISTGWACVLFIYTLSFFQLYRESFHYKTAR